MKTEHDIHLQFDSSVEKIEDINESFSSGVMKICYTGLNRNGSSISKEAIERAIPTMFNCPVVCNYDVETDSIGGHDVAFLATADGSLRMVNLTNAVGVIPAGAKAWWETFDDHGEDHDYFMTEVLLWKRSPAFQKISEDGIVSQSMEISVKRGTTQDGVLYIEDFVFTAFCLLGDNVEPCFEDASLQLYQKDEMNEQFSQMMRELKDSFSTTQSSQEVCIHPQNKLEGGEKGLEEKQNLMAEYGLTVEMLDFSIEDLSLDELREKFEALKQNDEQIASVNIGEHDANIEQFALEEQFRKELAHALQVEKVETDWGKESRYWLWDYDKDISEVYAMDSVDWNLYGMPYSMDGDRVIIDFNAKKRMKLAVEPFDEGTTPNPMNAVFARFAEKYAENDTQWAEKYQAASDTISSMETELNSLRQFKTDTENAIANQEREEVFAQFDDLAGVEAFEVLKENCSDLSKEALEDKCFAIRGRNMNHTFAAQKQKATRLPVEKNKMADEPYGGLFVEFPPTR